MRVALLYNLGAVIVNLIVILFLLSKYGDRRLLPLNVGSAIVSAILALMCWSHL